MKITPVNLIHVYIQFSGDPMPLGRLLRHQGEILFEYTEEFINRKLEVSPFHLPLKPGVHTGKPELFDSLPGLFYDSLPDGWGRLLLDRSISVHGIPPQQLTALDRLAFVGQKGMGALIYEPDIGIQAEESAWDLDLLAQESTLILQGESTELIEQLLTLGGSSSGARPKVLVGYNPTNDQMISGQKVMSKDFEHWIVKFPSNMDDPDIGLIEMAYSLMAKTAGIEMTDTKILPGKYGKHYFATKRFDRQGKDRLHVHTASGLLNADHRYPSLDYENLMRGTLALCKDIREVEKVLRLAAFNVFAHNRDDHSKNFSFIMDHEGNWSFAPAYDLTFSYGPGGEHSSIILGEGKHPGTHHLLKLAQKFQFKKPEVIIEEVKEAVSQWNTLAAALDIRKQSIKNIGKRIELLLKG